MISFQIFALLVLCLVLIYATSIIIGAVKTIASASRLGTYGITAFILAISTSLPELVVSVVSSIEGNSSLILGNIIGSNIADISLVVGGAAIIGGSLVVKGVNTSRDIYLSGLAGLLPIFLVADGILSRADGVVLVVVYCIFVVTFLKNHHQSLVDAALRQSAFHRLLSSILRPRGKDGLIRFGFGVILLLTSSHFIVRLATSLALSTSLSSLFIGLFIVAVGTSLPELAFEIKAILSGHNKMALGDLLGSVVANSTLILGLASIVSPITLTHRGLIPYSLAIGAFSALYLGFIFFTRTKKRLDWWEGLILLTVYALFMFVEYHSGTSLLY